MKEFFFLVGKKNENKNCLSKFFFFNVLVNGVKKCASCDFISKNLLALIVVYLLAFVCCPISKG